MLIREAQPADADAIATIRERTIRTVVAPLNEYTPDEIEAWAANYTAERVETFIAEGNYLVAEEGGAVVGLGRLTVDQPGHAIVRGVFVAPEVVGRGIGTQIVQQLLARGQNLGITVFELVATLNARSFYERLGFSFIKRLRHPTANGAIIPGLHMKLEVIGK
jgi:N-acetylglutamate synthase-like GNAT family acetyltransferase